MAIPVDQVIRERQFLAAHSEWNIAPVGSGSRFRAERGDGNGAHVIVCMSLRELLDRLDKIVGGER